MPLGEFLVVHKAYAVVAIFVVIGIAANRVTVRS